MHRLTLKFGYHAYQKPISKAVSTILGSSFRGTSVHLVKARQPIRKTENQFPRNQGGPPMAIPGIKPSWTQVVLFFQIQTAVPFGGMRMDYELDSLQLPMA